MPKHRCHSHSKLDMIKNNTREPSWTAGLLGSAFANLKQVTTWGSKLEMWDSSSASETASSFSFLCLFLYEM